ncbi:hypothetical protein D3C87_171240 [compost metagenome]
MKATDYQIHLIGEALKKIGVNYIDIRHEMTDHIAATLEETEGNFEDNLSQYIISHRKELRKTNRKFVFISMVNAYKKLLANMFTLNFLALFLIIFINASLIGLFIERESVIRIMFMAFSVVVCISFFPGLYSVLKRRDSHSYSHGFSFLSLIMLYPSIFMIGWQREIADDNLVLLYYTAVLSVSVIMNFTIKQFNTQYKLRYNV